LVTATSVKKGSTGLPFLEMWSGIRDSNSRPIPWQGIALPTELIPHIAVFYDDKFAFDLRLDCFKLFCLSRSAKT
jgi:hypothetical protein